ncbi:uncharacterized protein LOC125656974 [Ostrea edulis]|uniref:uncharacterized protein LOC125656974 n=1 Tax=Ostrea edulis TaxID=37623 RepID=UPI0024AEB488|nr:uncharacterized protein LOC125656974 [Ostrea edulis]
MNYRDEQNGFRRGRSCEDHVFTLNSLIQNNKNLYVAFIDLKKCFDFVDRDMMLYKLLLNDINGKMYNSIKNIYQSSESCVRVNGKLTNWFSCKTGVKQGDNLSPTLFSIFANDLVHEINSLDVGVNIADEKLSVLLYEDDIALIAKTPEELQCMLQKLHNWCRRWRVLINTEKSKCMHFRKTRTKGTAFEFTIGTNTLEIVDSYKYLGIIFTYTGNFTKNAENLAKAGGRALGKIISTIHNNKEFGFTAYEKLFYSCVLPILDYSSSVWGFKKFQSIDNVQNRAIRYFLGVHRFAPLLAIYGDTGWIPSQYRRWINMIRFWNRVLLFDSERITRKVFEMDYDICRNNWCSTLKEILQNLELESYFDSKLLIDMNVLQTNMHYYYSNIWENEVFKVPKLRTYVSIKSTFGRENYVTLDMPKYFRSIMSQFRCGILPLRIETGRYYGEPAVERICLLCSLNCVEDEIHFLLYCPLYSKLRTTLFENTGFDQMSMSDVEVLRMLITNYPRQLAKYLYSSFSLRQSIIFGKINN